MLVATDISVFPNPFDHYVGLELTCEEKYDCIILLADLKQSKIVRMLGAGLSSGLNKIPLDNLGPLPKGTYQLDIKSAEGETVYQTMLIKQ